MAPEQMRTGPVDRRVDVFAAGIVLWEALTQRRLFKPDDPAAAFSMILDAPIDPPSTVNHDVPATLDTVVMKALDRNVATRFQTALEFADALEEAVPLASHRKVGDWVQRLCGTHLAEQSRRVSDIERSSSDPDSSKDAEALLRSRRGSIPAGPVDPTGSTADVVPASWPRTRSHQSALSRAEIPPSPSPDGSRIEVTPDRKTWPLVVAATVVVLLVGAGGVYWLRGAGRTTKVGFAPGHFVSASASTMARPSQPAPLPPPAAQQAPVVEQPAQVAEDAHSAAAAPAPAAGSGPRRLVGTPGRHKAKAKAKSVPVKVSRSNKPLRRTDCDPPYYVDYQGIRRVKPQCF
jgi:serine/threonine-protein kinase